MSRLEKYLPFILALIIPLMVVFNYSSFVEEIKIRQIVSTYCGSAAVILLIWYSNKLFIRLSIQTFQKALISIGGNLTIVISLAFLGAFTAPEELIKVVNFWLLFFRLSLMVVMFHIVLRIFQTQRERSKLEVRNIELQSENLKFQVETLKQQINPHFLFNSLNTLLDLIEDKSEEAADFTRKFSNLYRVVLQSLNYDYIPLNDELKFLDDYWRLLQVRFRDAIRLKILIDERNRDLNIPPLSLQFLVENAVKHNEASSRKPLEIVIRDSKSHLIVSNNINPKKYPVQSEKVGLENLQKRFSLLIKPIEFGVKGEEFVVKLPLKL